MSAGRFKHRPIFGGVFGQGRYALASVPRVANGLHAVEFMVIDPRAGAVLSIAQDKGGALSSARSVLVASLALASEERASPSPVQWKFWPDDTSETPSASQGAQLSRRRVAVFQKSGGRCHYCQTPLTLSGRWHVEHMMPRALLGTDDPLNLVAACVPCNLAKSDRTAIEYMASRAECDS